MGGISIIIETMNIIVLFMYETTIYYCTVLPDLFLSVFLEVDPCQEEQLKKLDAISNSVDRVEKKMIHLDEELDGIEKVWFML